MFSFTSGETVAYISGGPCNNKKLRLKGDEKEGKSMADIIKDSGVYFEYDWIDDGDVEELADALSGKCGVPDDLVEPFIALRRELRCGMSDSDNIKINDSGMIVPVLNPSRPDRIYIAGPSGSGKSTLSGKLMKGYNILYPKNKIWVFSKFEKDIAFDGVKNIERVPLDETLITDPIDIKELSNSLVLVDDIDTIREKDILDAMRKLRDDILECGRKEGIYTICTSHLIHDAKKTKIMVNEATKVVFFPASGSIQQIKRFLKEYAGLSEKAMKMITRLPSRWVLFSKDYPQYLLYEKGAMMVKCLP